MEMDRRRQCEDESRNQSIPATSQGTPIAANNHWKSGERQGRLLPVCLQNEHGPTNTLLSDV